MNTLILNNKKYVVVEQKAYNKLVKQAATKTSSAQKMSLAEAKKSAYALIDKWHKEK